MQLKNLKGEKRKINGSSIIMKPASGTEVPGSIPHFLLKILWTDAHCGSKNKFMKRCIRLQTDASKEYRSKKDAVSVAAKCRYIPIVIC